MGETCGMKFVNTTHNLRERCKVCEKIDTKKRRRAAEAEKINRWTRDGGKLRASIEKSWEEIRKLDAEILELEQKRALRIHSCQAGGAYYANPYPYQSNGYAANTYSYGS